MLKQIFTNNVTLEIVQIEPVSSDPAKRIVGYVFASPGIQVGSQQQRWVLYDHYSSKVGIQLRLQQPTETRRYTSLENFRNAVSQKEPAGIWRSGATYVKVEANASDKIVAPKAASLVLGATPAIQSSTMSNMSNSRRQAPPRTSRGPGGIPKGLDKLTTRRWTPQFHDRVHILQNEIVAGIAFGTHLEVLEEGSFNDEFWVLRPSYQAPASNRETGTILEVLTDSTGTVEGFLDEMNGTWEPGSTLVTARCSYYQELPATL